MKLPELILFSQRPLLTCYISSPSFTFPTSEKSERVTRTRQEQQAASQAANNLQARWDARLEVMERSVLLPE